jgi:hypothetical protein
VTHLLNPIGATLIALLAALALGACGDDDDSGDDQRSATQILRALPSGYEYEPISEAQEDQVLRQSLPPEGALEEIEDVEMRRVLQGGEVIGSAMAIVSGRELDEDDVLRGFTKGVGGDPATIELDGKDGRLATYQGFQLIIDVAGTEMVVVAATDGAGVRRLAGPVLLD